MSHSDARSPKVLLAALLLMATGCAPRVIVTTGTTLGIKATPGDGQTRPPQFVVGYKRVEVALIPVEGGGATKSTEGGGAADEIATDAASTVASFYLRSGWRSTEIRSAISTGFAARHVVDKNPGDSASDFGTAFEAAVNKREEAAAKKSQEKKEQRQKEQEQPK